MYLPPSQPSGIACACIGEGVSGCCLQAIAEAEASIANKRVSNILSKYADVIRQRLPVGLKICEEELARQLDAKSQVVAALSSCEI